MKKRILYTLLILIAVFMCGCASNPKNFSIGDLTITLNKGFKEQTDSNFDIYLVSDDIIFTAVNESESDVEYSGYEINSLKDYSLEIAELNKVNKSSIKQRGNYYYFVNKGTTSGANYTYVHCMFQGRSSYWICEFVCKTKNYDRFKDNIFKWADSIVINQ